MGQKSKDSGTSLSLGDVELKELAKEINMAVEVAVETVAKNKIIVGQALLKARLIINDDQAFGKWRKSETVVKSKQHAHYLMQIAEKFGEFPELIESVNYSTLQELVLADQADIKWVEEKVAAGEPPTIKETRAKVKQTQAERLAPKELKGTSKKALALSGEMKTVPMALPNAALNEVVQMNLTRRINEVKNRPIDGIEGALIVLGLDPDPQCPCNPEIMFAIRAYWDPETGASLSDGEFEIIDEAIDKVEEDFKNW